MSELGLWQWTPLQMEVFCRGLERVVLPAPLKYTRATETQEDLARAYVEAAEMIVAEWDSNLMQVATVLTDPEIRIQFMGFADELKYRVHVAIRSGPAVIVDQRERDGLIRIRLFDRGPVTELLETLPKRDAGTGGHVRGEFRDLDPDAQDDCYGYPDSWLEPVGNSRPDPKQQFLRFTEKPQVGHGFFQVFPGPTLDNRPNWMGREFRYVDLADGRYLVRHHDEDIYVEPIDQRGLAQFLVGVIRDAQDEYQEWLYEDRTW